MKMLMALMISCMTLVALDVRAAELTVKEKAALMSAVKHELKDPDSAKFKWPKLPGRIDQKHFVDTYCGLVNAKNSYGGYVGFEPFKAIVSRSDNGKFEVIDITMISAELPADAIVSLCSDAGYTDFTAAK